MIAARRSPSPRRPPRPRRRRRGDDRGSATVEMVGYTAPALLVITLIVQVLGWALADLSARVAANHALQTARVLDGTAEAGQADGDTVLKAIIGAGLTDHTVAVDRAADVTTVTITGAAIPVIPFLRLPIRVSVQGPTEDPNAISAP